jgi:hypothetical protein
MVKIQNTPALHMEKQALIPCWKEWKPVSHFGRQFGSLVQNQTYSYHRLQQSYYWDLPKSVENISPHTKLHTNIFICFIHNCQNLKTNKMSLNRLIKTLCCIHIMEYFPAIKRNDLPNHEDTRRNLKRTLLSGEEKKKKTFIISGIGSVAQW